VAAESGVAEHRGDKGSEGEQQPDAGGESADDAVARSAHEGLEPAEVIGVDGLVVAEPLCGPAECAPHAEGDDEGGELNATDRSLVDRDDERCSHDAADGTQRGVQRSPGPDDGHDPEHGGGDTADVADDHCTDGRPREQSGANTAERGEERRRTGLQKERDDDGDQGDGRADRQVDPAGDDDQRRPDGRRAHHRRLAQASAAGSTHVMKSLVRPTPRTAPTRTTRPISGPDHAASKMWRLRPRHQCLAGDPCLVMAPLGAPVASSMSPVRGPVSSTGRGSAQHGRGT
jgi:hypothetical protein